MTSIRLVVDLDSIEVNARGSVTGRVFFTFDDSAAFPDHAWNDFVLVILEWWLKALALLQEGASSEAELLFMDGPFAIRLRRQGDGHLAADFLERSKNQIVRTATVQQAHFIREVAAAAEIVLSCTEQTSAAGSDVEELRVALRRVSDASPPSGKR